MATNLRLRRDAADAVRLEAERTGRSQQDVIRDAVDRHLGLKPIQTSEDELDALVAFKGVRRPRSAYRKASSLLSLPSGVTSAELLDRRDRIWVIVYADSSALFKRVVAEVGSEDLIDTLAHHVAAGDPIVASSLVLIEVSRALLKLTEIAGSGIEDAIDVALSGVAERPITSDVVSVARRIGPFELRSLDAIHLATATLLDADVVLTYDERLANACRYNGLMTASPGT